MDTNAKVISFFSSKGGAGTSVIALNTAILMSQKLKKKVLLIDADFEFGDIAAMVDEHDAKTIIDMVDNNHYKDYGEVSNYLYSYNDTMDILFAPRKPEASEFINEQMLKKILDASRGFYDYIIYDLGINFSDKTLFILDHSDLILYLTTMDFLSLKNTKVGLNLMHNLSYTEDKVKLVVNGVNSKHGINLSDVNEAFTEKIFAKIPEDIVQMRRAVNAGKPIAIYKKNSKVVRTLLKLCKDIERLW